MRNAVSLSAVTRKPIRIYNIRGKRAKPGLRAQHLNAINGVATLVNARTEGFAIDSREILFIPNVAQAHNFSIDVGTAGSTTLVLQALMPAAVFAGGSFHVEIRGGTNNPMAPPIDFLQRVLVPTLRRMNVSCEVVLVRRGFYPRGQGIVRLSVNPLRVLSSILIEDFGEVTRISGISYSSRLPNHITARMAESANDLLQEAQYGSADFELEMLDRDDSRCAFDPGCGIAIFAELSSGAILSGDALGAPGKPAEEVGAEAAKNLVDQLRTRSPVDKHLGDQLVVWASLAEGESRLKVTELTLHTLTAAEISRRIAGAEFKIEGQIGRPATLACAGIGLRNELL